MEWLKHEALSSSSSTEKAKTKNVKFLRGKQHRNGTPLALNSHITATHKYSTRHYSTS
jgi:hypothetical protein